MANTTNFNWETPDDTDLVKDGAAAIRTLGSAIDTSLVDLKGGTTDQVLAKNSNTDMDFKWVTSDDTNAIQNSIIDAKGDLIVGSAADTPARLAVGTNGHILVADSAEATGLKWAAPASGGKVLQVVSSQITTSTSIATSTFTDTNISLSITPTSATSKVFVIITGHLQGSANQGDFKAGAKLFRGATELQSYDKNQLFAMVADTSATENQVMNETNLSFTYLDSPATTSATTYKIQGACDNSLTTAIWQNGTRPSTITLMEIGA